MAQQSGDAAKAVNCHDHRCRAGRKRGQARRHSWCCCSSARMLGQLCIEQKHPQEALEAFQAVLQVAPKRFNALYGARHGRRHGRESNKTPLGISGN